LALLRAPQLSAAFQARAPQSAIRRSQSTCRCSSLATESFADDVWDSFDVAGKECARTALVEEQCIVAVPDLGENDAALYMSHDTYWIVADAYALEHNHDLVHIRLTMTRSIGSRARTSALASLPDWMTEPSRGQS
jgi:hypothetical protein